MQSQNTSLNNLINYNMLPNNKQKMNNDRKITSARHFSTSTNIPKKLPYGDMFIESTSNLVNDSYHKTILSEINRTNQEFKQNLNDKPYNMEYQVAADMLKQESTSFYEKKMPETKPPPENNNSYKVDFYPVVLGVANFITGIFNNITGGGWAFSNKNTSEKEEKQKKSHFEDKEDLCKYSLFEEFSCINESPQAMLFGSEISLNDIKSMSENDVTVASINSQVEYQNKTVAAEQSALLNSFQSCRQRPKSPAFISDQYTYDNINDCKIVPQNIEKEENKEMNSQNKPNCTDAVGKCEDKLAKIKEILKKGGSNRQGPDTTKTLSKSIRNRRRRMFVPPNSIDVNSLDDIISEDEDSIERLQNMMVTKFSHPGLVVEPEMVEIEPALTLVNKSMNAADEVDFCTAMNSEMLPMMNRNEQDYVYIDSLKRYGQDCILNEKDGRVSPMCKHNTLENIESCSSMSVINENTDFGKTLPVIDSTSTYKPEEITVVATQVSKKAVISNCEDKIASLKEMLSKRKEQSLKDCNANPIQDSNGNHKICEDGEKLDDENYEQMNFGSVIPKKSTPKQVIKDKHSCKKHKNPNSKTSNKDKGRRLLKRNIDEDISLGRDLSALNLSSSLEEEGCVPKSRLKNLRRAQARVRRETNENPHALNIPVAAFDEVKGKFKKSPSDCSSDDSFIIVFSESPVATPPIESTRIRQRMASDAGSEDSFIICFESDNDNGNCYTNTDIFNESESESDSGSETESSESDSDTDISSDGDSMSNLVNCSFGNSMSRTISDLTDESLYADDSVLAPTSTNDSDDGLDKYGKLSDRIKKFRKDCIVSCMSHSRMEPDKVEGAVVATKPVKKVRFSEAAPQVLVLRVWAYAARAARVGPWERAARDRDRFQRRITDVDMAISWVLKPQHRTRVKFQRFMPWWNALRRQEVAEKKKKAEEDKIKQEEDRIKQEEDRIKQEEEDRIRLEKGGDADDHSKDEIVPKEENTQGKSGNGCKVNTIKPEKAPCNGNLKTNNILRLNGKKTPENNPNKKGNLTLNGKKRSLKDGNISKVQKTINSIESNKQNLYAIQVNDSNKIMIKN